jgi:hypothetical protein
MMLGVSQATYLALARNMIYVKVIDIAKACKEIW